MKTPSDPPDEAARLAALQSLDILDTPANERFDRITRIARRALGTKIALVSLIDGDRQWFKSAQGLSATETPRDISFCGHAIHGDDPLVVPDAQKDARFFDNPLVTGAPGIRLYAGQPIHGPTGHRLGTLCVIHDEPKSFETEDIELLRDLAALVESEVRLHRLGDSERQLRATMTRARQQAAIDPATRMWNRASILDLLRLEVLNGSARGAGIGVAVIAIDQLRTLTETEGAKASQEVLAMVAARIRSTVAESDQAGRFSPDQFMLVMHSDTIQYMPFAAERSRQRICQAPIFTSRGNFDVTLSIGLACATPTPQTTPEQLVEAAAKALEDARAQGGNKVVVAQTV